MQTPEGIISKYHVTRNNDAEGKHNDCWYFVLDIKHDPLAREALYAYAAEARAEGFHTLHDELLERLSEYREPCSCGDRKWVKDQNWSPPYYLRGMGRIPGDGLIPCGFCGDWDDL